MVHTATSDPARLARIRLRRLARLLTLTADALRAAGDVEGVAEAETMRGVVERRLCHVRAYRSFRSAVIFSR